MRLFRKLKRKFSEDCAYDFKLYTNIRKHRCWLYSIRKLTETYLYSDLNFEYYYEVLSKIEYKDAFDTASNWCCYYYSVTNEQLGFPFEKEESPYMLEFIYQFLICKMYNIGYKIDYLAPSFINLCLFDNRRAFMHFWTVYSQAPFWKKYKVWKKKQELENDFRIVKVDP